MDPGSSARAAPVEVQPPATRDVLAAGGIVRRRVRGRVRIAVVHRVRHGGDWTLPKGHVEPGEALEVGAIREVREETGWDARVTSFLTAITYHTEEGQKYVLFWNMDALSKRGEPARDEVVTCEWLSYAEAREKLTYSRERDIVAEFDGATTRQLMPRTLRDPQRERLAEEISVTRLRLCATHDLSAAQPPRWLFAAIGALDDAAAAAAAGAVDRGWALVHLAHELEVASYDHVAITAQATAILAELASPKFSGWRRAALCSQLRPVMSVDRKGLHTLGLAERRAWLAEAVRNRNEVYSNEYRNVAITRRYQAILLIIAMVILVGTLVGAAFANPVFEEGANSSWAAVAAALSGALGGITSALQRTARRSAERIPERLGSLVSSLSRPTIGAIAGVTVFLAVRAGVTQTASEQQVAYLLLLAFGAGFTERLVVRDPREELADRSARIEATGTTGVLPAMPAPTAAPGDALPSIEGTSPPDEHSGQVSPTA
ncbi:MAG TPA: NUDIX domain-containing protein [Ilumatobacteraceae bacterium]|nr:NUDIX domain-containing protein [Ilumatobacteraceae bacterium]